MTESNLSTHSLPLLLSLDLGMGAIKLSSNRGNYQILSQIAVAGGQGTGKMIGLLSAKPPLRIDIASAGSFYVDGGSHDAGRPIENMSMDRFQGSPEMRCLLYGILTRLILQSGPIESPLSLILGLPLQAIVRDDSTNVVEAVQKWMRGRHTWTADDQPYSVEIREIRATSQPAGALFDYILDDQGRMIPERRSALTSETGVISIGMNTVEILVVREKTVVDRFTAGSTSGVRRLLDLLNPQKMYSTGELDLQLRAGHLDISAALPVWEREVMGEIEKVWGSTWRRFHTILLVGGGAHLLRGSLPYRFKGKAVLPEDPVFSIVRGLWKLALYQQQRRPAAQP